MYKEVDKKRSLNDVFQIPLEVKVQKMSVQAR